MTHPSKDGVAVWRLDDIRFAVSLDRVVRYVGSQEECQRRADILFQQKGNREDQDVALPRALGRIR